MRLDRDEITYELRVLCLILSAVFALPFLVRRRLSIRRLMIVTVMVAASLAMPSCLLYSAWPVSFTTGIQEVSRRVLTPIVRLGYD